MERIQVAVRARPLSEEDAKTSPWRISANSIFISNHSSKFDFDRIFGEDCKTIEVYQARTKEIVAAAVCGFNGTVFAYGQTNSGKTYTMRGSATEPGIIPLSVHDLFKTIQQDVDREFLLRMSYMEIYNEEINDLLAPEHRKLQIHESLERGIYVAGLREEIVASPEQVLDLMEFGESHRHIGETNMNLYSSRSHTIFRMIIESRNKSEDEDMASSCDAVRVSVLNLVDLAGSERAAKTGAEGVRLKEGSHINKSLMTLGTVIKKLSEGAESQGGHVPYRDSKLTRILQPALGGNSNTAIICNITLAQVHADETKSSLQFASRALRVTNCARVNEILTDAALLKRQKKEIEELRAKLQGSHSEHLEEEILNLRNTLLQTELERERIALELEEEKKAQAEWEKRVQDQAKQIENLSTMVLYSTRDENRDRSKKDKRRDTWCPGNLSREVLGERTVNEIQIDCLIRKLGEADLLWGENSKNYSMHHVNQCTINGDKNVSLRESEAILVIKRLQEQIKMLEMEKSSSQHNLDSVVELATEQHICAREKFKELYEELQFEREEARMAREQLNSNISESTGDRNSDFSVKLSLEIQELLLEVQNLKEVDKSVLSLVDEDSKSFSALFDAFLDFRNQINQSSVQQNAIISNQEKLTCHMRKRVSELEDEKLLLYNQTVDIQKQLQNQGLDAQNTELSLKELLEQQDLEKEHFLFQIQALEKELLSLSSSSLAKDKENLRKDLEKTKARLKETEFKLKNAVQEKTKLEGEKASAEREIKRLLGQNSLLERDISKRDSVAGRRRDSVIDPKRAKGSSVFFEQTMQEGNKKLEVLAFEYETAIASLEEELATAYREKEEAILRNECMASEIEALSEQMKISSKDLNVSKEEVSALRQYVEDYKSNQQKMENSIRKLVEEKEELAMQLSDSLLEMEEERAIWSTKERVSVRAIEEQGKLYDVEIMKLSRGMTEVRNELESCQEECRVLRERLTSSEKNVVREKQCSMEKSFEIDELKFVKKVDNVESEQSQEMLQSNSEMLSLEHNAYGDVQMLKRELSFLYKEREDLLIQIRELDTRSELSTDLQNLSDQLLLMTKERDKLMSQIEEQQRQVVEMEFRKKHCNDTLSEAKAQVEELNTRISSMEVKMHKDEVDNGKEKAKLRMRLRGTQAKLDAFRSRYREAMEESDLMNKRYEEAAGKLKDRLASKGIEVLNLKKQLATAMGQGMEIR
ncbi:kinesin-like protein KIN-7O isoform X2 [Juglans microcarpa x Juglans regia]|uniref:kinesin-like protein KIN-7O isoform X2 n=1 Tax=Juglans microcarpa x Juglans regia TaxID=2249226 RepID=UPI001B7E03D7|nr:kinesin-like protein KIN-7O isoform X2 [Juglans microcarpa x Juglans regia]